MNAIGAEKFQDMFRQRHDGTLTIILVLKTDDLSCANQDTEQISFVVASLTRIPD